ncbi:MAG: glycine cleavage system protein GcvH [Candidatus Dormibacteraceae bacterium]
MGERRYTASHEWIEIDGDTATVGITDFAQAQLGDVVFLELPAAGASLGRGDTFGVIESVKAASDLYSPAAGEIVEVNERLAQNPELVNSDPYGAGWLLRIRLSAGTPDGLLDEAAYTKVTEAGH